MTETQLRPREAAPARAVPLEPDARVDRVTVIRPSPRWPHLDISDLWHYRELLFRLAWRDVAVRYKQTSIGIAWAILQPFLTMVVFTLVFGKFANFSSNGLPYQIFVYSALLPWTYFASSVALVNRLTPVAEEMNHHPDLEISWNEVTVTISTHSEGGLTANDFELAQRIDAVA